MSWLENLYVLTLIRLGFLKVVFSIWGPGQFDPPHPPPPHPNFMQLLNNLFKDLRKFNEIFRKDEFWDNITSYKKPGSHPIFRRYLSRKTTRGRGGQFDSLGILGLKNRYTKTFRQTDVNKFYYKIFLFYQIIFKIWIFKKTVTILIFNSTCFTFFIIMSEFKFNSMQSFR